MCSFHSLCLNHLLLGNLTTACSLCIPKGPWPCCLQHQPNLRGLCMWKWLPSSRATRSLITDDLAHSLSILPRPAYWLLARFGHFTLDVPTGSFYEFCNLGNMFWSVPLGRGTFLGHRCDVKPELTEFIFSPQKDNMNMKNISLQPFWRSCLCEACYRTGPRQPSPFPSMVYKHCWVTEKLNQPSRMGWTAWPWHGSLRCQARQHWAISPGHFTPLVCHFKGFLPSSNSSEY